MTFGRVGPLLGLLALGALAGAQERKAAPPADADGIEFFEKKIRPVLADKCFSCHSSDAPKVKGGLRLDTREGTLKGGESGAAAVIAGDPDHSLLLKAIRYGKDDELKMPPKGPPLAPEVLHDFETWIRRGAPDPRSAPVAKVFDFTKAREHWSFRPLREPAVPAVSNRSWVKSPIDAFILARLDANGMKPSAAADRRTLIRRASFDLLGLPPTAEEIEAFVADPSPDALESLLDRLLASPRYGERWGRHWLDVARYSDTKGYVFQEERRYPFAFTYRDWVIRSLNEDLPYDQFLIQQIAADRLPLGEDKRPLAAMGFLTLGRRFLNRLPDIIDDRIDVLCRGTMGLTVACARCHDHKFDPIPTKDYYSLYGVFASSIEPKDPPLLGMGQKTKENLDFEAESAKLQAEVTKYREGRHADIQASVRKAKAVADYLLAAQEARALKGDEELRNLAQKKDLIGYFIARWKVLLEKTSKAHDRVFAPWHAMVKGPGSLQGLGELHPLVAEAFKEAPKTLKEAAERYAALLTRADAPDDLKAILSGPEAPTSIALADIEKAYNRADRDKQRQLENKVDALKASHPGAPQRAMSFQDGPIQEPHVLIRGNPNNPGEQVPRQFLAILSPEQRQPFKDGSGRLELARAIASKDNPLTARVLVNRVWGYHFGAAIVRTPSDFGLRSDPPTHPELLDWLALRFIEGGWSIKKLHKLIMTSAAWQQRSDDLPAFREKDPENRFVWKCSRQRLDFEAMRDSILAVSGQMDLAMGGRPVELSENPTSKKKMQAETIINTVGDPTQETYAKRRSVYLFIDRQNLPGTFRAFDFASPDTHSPQRYTTTVPQQALFLMNSPFVTEQVGGLVKRPEIDGERDVQTRIRNLYRILFGRAPAADELAIGRRYLDLELKREGPVALGPNVWQYGYGKYDEAAKRVVDFRPLPHFTGMAWQGGPKLPDPKLGWVLLTAEGGHPASVTIGAAVRRWTAPQDGAVSVSGVLGHHQKDGDGVRARIVSSQDGELASWTAHNTEAETKMSRIEVKKGDTIDFVVDCRGDETSDSFVWAPVIRLVEAPGNAAGGTQEWSAVAEFRGPEARPRQRLSAWERYAQVLLLSNEFIFVD
ncbi:MAG TPA: PSD1 and planctomycete cytochrome C domain-containing protein [Planctomycetota bacterium]|nr:PSD1 and planctomycete cytochrome C domain-containing protein [Planctomycetota bacterium]